MNTKSSNQLNKLIKKTINFYHTNSEKLPQLSHEDYLLLSEFNSLMDLVNIVLLLSDDSAEEERYCVMHLLSHGLIQYQVEYENGIPHKADFTLAQSIQSLISRQLAAFNLNGFFVAREVINALFSANIEVDEDFLSELNNAEYLCDAYQKNAEDPDFGSAGFDGADFENTDFGVAGFDSVGFDGIGFEGLILQFEQMVEAFDARTDYDVYLQISEQLNQMPAEAGQLMFNSMLQTKNNLSRDASILLLLHPLAKVRNNILEGLSLFAKQKLLNAKDYNRLLILRNWLNDNDKKIVDNAIKLIQKSQISFEHDRVSEKKKIHQILLTPTDNGGCMALQIAFKQSRQFFVFGCVLKQDYGIKDAFITDYLSKSDYQHLLIEASNGLPMCSISFEQFETLLSHFLKLNLIKNNNIPAEVLLLKEYSGASWLQPQLIDLPLVESYLEKQPQSHLKSQPKDMQDNSQPFFELDDFIVGWASPGYLADHQSIKAIINHELEPYRLVWYERLKLTCFCFAENINGIDVFMESARQIKAGKKLQQIRLFQEIAEQVLQDGFL